MFTDAKKPRSQQGLLSQQNTIAQGTTFEGDLKSEGDFRIEGAIIGTLTTKGKVVIGSTSTIAWFTIIRYFIYIPIMMRLI